MAQSAAESIIKDITKKFGEGSAYLATNMPPVTVVHSGSLTLDYAIGIGGMPGNRVVELAGSEGSSKTTTALLIAKNMIEKDPDRVVIWADVEHKLSPKWMETILGDAINSVAVVNPDTIEQATDMFRKLVTSGKVSMFVLDSIGGAPTAQTMDEGRSAEQAESIGGNAKGMAKFSRFAANLSAKYNCLVIGINQQREDVKSRHGNMFVTPGGRAWKHACVLRIQLRRGVEKYSTKVGGEDVVVGFDIIARVIKNQLGGEEGRTAQWRFFTRETEMFGEVGIDSVEECSRLAKITGVIQRAGAYYRHPSFPDGQVQGDRNVSHLLHTDESIRKQIIEDVMNVLRKNPEAAAEASPLAPVDEEWAEDEKEEQDQ